MDTGNGKFVKLEPKEGEPLVDTAKKLEKEYPKHGSWFRVGQIVDCEGSTFRVKSVKPTELRLKLLHRVK